MASGSFSSSSINGLSLYVDWSSTENVSANTSSVTARLYVKSYGFRASALSGSYLTINGSTKNWTYSFSIADTSTLKTTQVATYTVTVPHNSDGTKSITIKANMKLNGTYGGTYISDLTTSKSVTLGTIPRSSSFSVPASVNTGSNLSIAITPSSSSFRHRFKFEIDGESKYTSGYVAVGTNSYSYTIPHDWLPKATSKAMTVYCYTYPASGDDYIAKVSKTVTVNVPSNIKPSISEFTATVSSGLNDKYIQGKSKVKLVATAKASSGSTISSYIFKGANISGTASSCTVTSTLTSYTRTSSVIQSSGALTYQVAVKDARGRISDYKSVSINVYTYAAPQIKSISAQRCSADGKLNANGTYAKITVKTSYVAIDGANTRTVKIYSSKDNYATGTTVLSTSDTDNTYTGVYSSGFAENQNYTIKAIITDKYSSHSRETTLRVSERTFNIAKYGNGVAIGGLSTVEDSTAAGKFECNWDATFANTITATRGRITANTDISGSEQDNAPLRIGDANDSHLDFDTNEIISKDNPTTVGRLNIMGYPLQFYLRDGERVMYLNSDETSSYIRSEITYNRTYDASPNMYITSNGVLGRATSSSQRYKTDIADINDTALDPYQVLNIPVRQYKYNSDNIPIGKNADDVYMGLIAEEVAKAYPAAAEYNEEGQVEMWNIKVLVPAMLKIIQDQQKSINELKQKVEDLEMNT